MQEKFTERVRKILSEVQKTKIGPLAPNWQNGRSFESYGKGFNNIVKNRIRDRDEYKCQLCGVLEKGGSENLSIHHIDYNKQNNSGNNLIALCRACNSKVNSNRNFWKNYFLDNMRTQLKNLTLTFKGEII